MAEKKILTLHLSDEWYQKIANGEKTEEYRECSVYWVMRLIAKDAPNRIELIYNINIAREKGAFMYGYVCQGGTHASDSPEDRAYRQKVLEPFTHVHFVSGYPKDNQPHIEREINEITVCKPKKGMCPEEWLDKYMFVIRFK